jgi:hypothetical protein
MVSLDFHFILILIRSICRPLEAVLKMIVA